MQVEWRRNKVLELLSMGNPQTDIAKTLQVDLSIISRDVSHLRQQSKQNIRKYIDEKLPEEYEKCLIGLTAILMEAWTTSEEALDRREKIQALALAKDCYITKLDLLTNATVVDDAIRFVSEHKNHEKPKSDRMKQEQQQDNEMITKTNNVTSNQVF
jgi:hypothetical protein